MSTLRGDGKREIFHNREQFCTVKIWHMCRKQAACVWRSNTSKIHPELLFYAFIKWSSHSITIHSGKATDDIHQTLLTGEMSGIQLRFPFQSPEDGMIFWLVDCSIMVRCLSKNRHFIDYHRRCNPPRSWCSIFCGCWWNKLFEPTMHRWDSEADIYEGKECCSSCFWRVFSQVISFCAYWNQQIISLF